MKKIAKVRLSIIGFIALLSTGIVLLWANWHPQKYVGFDENDVFVGADVEDIGSKLLVAGFIAALLIVPAVVLLWATFFTLNEKGQVPRGSWLYKIIKYFAPYKEVEKKGGKKVRVKDVPEEVRFCPTFYKLVYVATGIYSVLISIVAIPWVIHDELTNGRPMNWDAEWSKLFSWEFLLAFLTFVVGTALLVWLITKLVGAWQRLRETLIGRLIAAVYDRACVKLEVEPVSASE